MRRARPAAAAKAVPRGRAGAKAHPKAALRRPAGAPADRRARGAHPGEADPPGEARSVEDRYKAGEVIASASCPPTLLQADDWIRTSKAKYFGETVKLAAKISKVELSGNGVELILHATGTDSEELLKYLTSLEVPVVRAHLCGADCTQLRVNPDLVHVSEIQKVLTRERLVWEENLLAKDELPALRGEQERWHRGERAEKGDGSSTESRKKRKQKKEKRKEKRKERKELKKKVGGRANATKKVGDLYAGTGLDPVPKNRLLLKRKVKKQLKRSKLASSSGSDSSGTTSSSEDDDFSMIEERSKIQRIAELGPGLLSLEAVNSMKRFILQASGTPWSMSEDSVPPLVSQYVRQACLPKAGGAMGRELVTLAHIADLLIQARPSEALDVAVQRIKSLELTAGGQPWTTSQKVEVIPPTDTQIAGRAELHLAQKEVQLDSKAKGSTPAQYGDKGKQKGAGKSKEKGKDKGKDRGKGGSKDDSKKSS